MNKASPSMARAPWTGHNAHQDVNAPSLLDVICGRGTLTTQNHLGNHRFRSMIRLYQATYLYAISKAEKLHLSDVIVQQVRSQGGRFSRSRGKYVDVGDHLARRKVSRALRGHYAGFQPNLPSFKETTMPEEGDVGGDITDAAVLSELYRAQRSSFRYLVAHNVGVNTTSTCEG